MKTHSHISRSAPKFRFHLFNRGFQLQPLISQHWFQNKLTRIILATILVTLTGHGGQPPLIFEGTEIYKYLIPSRVCISDSGDVFILDLDEKSILHYANDGTALPRIGRQGSGPGEFRYPVQIDWYEDALYVMDMKMVHEFDGEGSFIRKLDLPDRMFRLDKVFNGWVGLAGLFQISPDETTKLLWFSDNLEQQETLAEWPGESERNPGAKPILASGVQYFNPAKEYTRMVLNHARDTVVVRLSGTSHLYGIDLKTKKQIFDIEVPGEKIPFDEEAGQRRFERFEKAMKVRGTRFKVEPDFPEFFPLIKAIKVSPFDQLVVFKWFSGELEPEDIPQFQQDYLLWYNFKGESVARVDVDFKLSRVIKATDTHVYLTCYLETEEWSVARVPRADVAAFLEANPLPSQNDL